MAETREGLTSAEEATFNAEWSLMLMRHFRYREVMDVFEDFRDQIKETAAIAKYELEATFGGANARTNEFGWMPIMPQHLLTGDSRTIDLFGCVMGPEHHHGRSDCHSPQWCGLEILAPSS